MEFIFVVMFEWVGSVVMVTTWWVESVVVVAPVSAKECSCSMSCSESLSGLRTPHTAQLVILDTRWASIGEKPRPPSQWVPASWPQEQRWWQQRAITIPLSLDVGLRVQTLFGLAGPSR